MGILGAAFRTCRWSWSAGGRTGSVRTDQTAELPDGATLLLLIDGLVARRGATLDPGLDRLQAALGDLAALPLDEPWRCPNPLQMVIYQHRTVKAAQAGLRAGPDSVVLPGGGPK